MVGTRKCEFPRRSSSFKRSRRKCRWARSRKTVNGDFHHLPHIKLACSGKSVNTVSAAVVVNIVVDCCGSNKCGVKSQKGRQKTNMALCRI